MMFKIKKINVCELSSFLEYFVCIKVITVKLWGPEFRPWRRCATCAWLIPHWLQGHKLWPLGQVQDLISLLCSAACGELAMLRRLRCVVNMMLRFANDDDDDDDWRNTNNKSRGFWPAYCREASKKHDTETSCEWSQLWFPHPACMHCVNLLSWPVHSTLSNHICPLPDPCVFMMYWPLYLTKYIHLWNGCYYLLKMSSE